MFPIYRSSNVPAAGQRLSTQRPADGHRRRGEPAGLDALHRGGSLPRMQHPQDNFQAQRGHQLREHHEE